MTRNNPTDRQNDHLLQTTSSYEDPLNKPRNDNSFNDNLNASASEDKVIKSPYSITKSISFVSRI